MLVCTAKLNDSAVYKAMNQPLFAHPTRFGKMLRNAPIVDKVRQIRERYLTSFDYDLQALFEDLKRQEAQSGGTFASYPARSIFPYKAHLTGTGLAHLLYSYKASTVINCLLTMEVWSYFIIIFTCLAVPKTSV